jgi:drug/metabolite transporter (DMT)-like permease
MNQALLASLLGLSSAIVWGAGDFCGGLASRRSALMSVLILAEFTGFVLLVVAGFVVHEKIPVAAAIAWSVAAGVSGTIGLGSLYKGLSIGRASVVAPVSAVIGSTIPALYTAYRLGLPGRLKVLGFVLALVAIILASQSSRETKKKKALSFAMLAGVGFAGFFIFINAASSLHSTFFPLAIARGFPIPFMVLLSYVRKIALPSRDTVGLILLTGVLDAAGTVFFLLSSTLGRLDIATVLSSLFPASTVLLSSIVLREKISLLQKVGVLLALTAILLIVW